MGVHLYQKQRQPPQKGRYTMRTLTRKEMISACVDNQIERGIVYPENREMQIKNRLKGGYGLRAMSWSECKSWYDSVINKKPRSWTTR